MFQVMTVLKDQTPERSYSYEDPLNEGVITVQAGEDHAVH